MRSYEFNKYPLFIFVAKENKLHSFINVPKEMTDCLTLLYT